MKTKFIVFVCFVALIHSCKRADQVIPAPDSKYSGKIYYTSFCYEYDSTSNFNYKQPIFYNASAQFFKEPINRQLEIVGDLMIGNYLVTFSNMYSEYCFTSTQRNDSLNLFQFGKKINFSISGGGDYSPVFTTVYVPKVIKIYSKNEPYQEHSKKDSMVIFWNPDPANATVEIDLMYDGTFSHSIDSTLDANPYYLDPIIVPDNGQYTLPASFFTQFKPGSWINFSVTRNGHGEMLSNNKWIEINATTSSEFQRSIVN